MSTCSGLITSYNYIWHVFTISEMAPRATAQTTLYNRAAQCNLIEECHMCCMQALPELRIAHTPLFCLFCDKSDSSLLSQKL